MPVVWICSAPYGRQYATLHKDQHATKRRYAADQNRRRQLPDFEWFHQRLGRAQIDLKRQSGRDYDYAPVYVVGLAQCTEGELWRGPLRTSWAQATCEGRVLFDYLERPEDAFLVDVGQVYVLENPVPVLMRRSNDTNKRRKVHSSSVRMGDDLFAPVGLLDAMLDNNARGSLLRSDQTCTPLEMLHSWGVEPGRN